MRHYKKIRKKSELCIDAVSKLKQYESACDDITEYDKLLGLEGTAARVYFPQMFDNVLWNGRQPRIKANYVNALLDLGYSMLFNMADSMLQIYGFDTYCGVYHREFYMRKSLACDVMEPMRPIIDYIVRKGINLKQFKKDDFEVINQRYVLRYRECSKYVNVFMSGILQYKDEMFLFIQSYYRSFMKSKNITEYKRFEL